MTLPSGGIIPTVDTDLMRSHPQMSDMFLVIQQPQRFTDAPYLSQQEWVDYDWSCRVNGDMTAEITGEIRVNNGGAAASLRDGMTVLIGSEQYGDWDRGSVRLRTNQTVGPATTTLYIATSSDLRGRVFDGDYIVVLDEFRIWQRFGQVDVDSEGNITWRKDHNILWEDLGADDAARRLASMPPCPVMGPHAVKFVDPEEGDSAQFYFDWRDSYAMAPGQTITSWASTGETDHVGGTWVSAAETPGWQTVDDISGLRGYRVTLEVDDGNGNITTLPYRTGVRYVFTLRRPGQSQAHDPPNAEPITDFKLNGPAQGTYEQGYWGVSVTVYGEAASKYAIMPEALVILFTDDHYNVDSPYLVPAGLRNVSVGSIYDRENIFFVGRIDGSSIEIDSETETVSFDVLSPGAEAAMYHDYPIPIQDHTEAATWIDTPSLTPDRALWHYLCWHTTLPNTCDLFLPGDTHPIFAMDFLEGTIHDIADGFLKDRILGRMLCDRYGRFHCEYAAQYQPYGTTDTLWVLDDGDWADSLDIRQNTKAKVRSAEAGGLIFSPAERTVIPKLSRAPGQYDKYRGDSRASNSLAINSQWELNVIAGRYLEGMNYVHDVDIELAGYWPWLDIAPQRAIYINKVTERGTISARFLPRSVTFAYQEDAGCIFTSVQLEQEMNDGVPGVTIPIPEELPDLLLPEYGLPITPTFAPGFGNDAIIVPSRDMTMMCSGWANTTIGDSNAYYTDDVEAAVVAWTRFAGAIGGTADVVQDTYVEKLSTGSEYFYLYVYGHINRHVMPPSAGDWETTIVPFGNSSILGTTAGLDMSAFWSSCRIGRAAVSATQDGWQWITWRGFENTDPGETLEGNYYLGIAHTQDGWDSIAWSRIIYALPHLPYPPNLQRLEAGGIAINQWDEGRTIFAACYAVSDALTNLNEECKLFRSTDGGLSWMVVDTLPTRYFNPDTNYLQYPEVYIPYSEHSGRVIYWTDGYELRQSMNFGVSFATLGYLGSLPTDTCRPRMLGPLTKSNVANVISGAALYEYAEGSGIRHITPDSPSLHWNTFLVMNRDAGGKATKILLGNRNSEWYISEAGVLTDKTGNWPIGQPEHVAWPELREFNLPV